MPSLLKFPSSSKHFTTVSPNALDILVDKSNTMSFTMGVSRFLCKWDRGIFFLLFLSCVNTSGELCLIV